MNEDWNSDEEKIESWKISGIKFSSGILVLIITLAAILGITVYMVIKMILTSMCGLTNC